MNLNRNHQHFPLKNKNSRYRVSLVIVSALLTHNPLVATAKVLDLLSEGRIAPVYNEDIMSDIKYTKGCHSC